VFSVVTTIPPFSQSERRLYGHNESKFNGRWRTGDDKCEQAWYLNADRRATSLNRKAVGDEFLVNIRRRFTPA
jgi:hypothetical protein